MSAVWQLLKALPALISLIREVLRLIEKHQLEQDRKERAEKFKEAIKDAEENKDTRKLEEFFGCGDACNVPDGKQ